MRPTDAQAQPPRWWEDAAARRERIVESVGDAFLAGLGVCSGVVGLFGIGVAVMGRPTGFGDVLLRIPVGLGTLVGFVVTLVVVGSVARFFWERFTR